MVEHYIVHSCEFLLCEENVENDLLDVGLCFLHCHFYLNGLHCVGNRAFDEISTFLCLSFWSTPQDLLQPWLRVANIKLMQLVYNLGCERNRFWGKLRLAS